MSGSTADPQRSRNPTPPNIVEYKVRLALLANGKETASHSIPIVVSSDDEATRRLESIRKLVEIFLVFG